MADEPIADANVLIFFENQLTYMKKHKESPQEPVYTGCLKAYVVFVKMNFSSVIIFAY